MPAVVALALAALALAGCPTPNPKMLWIAQGGGTSGIHLANQEPNPF